jgi:hypothetical protein
MIVIALFPMALVVVTFSSASPRSVSVQFNSASCESIPSFRKEPFLFFFPFFRSLRHLLSSVYRYLDIDSPRLVGLPS